MALPLILSATASVFIGYLGKDMIIGIGSAFWGNSLSMLSKHIVFVDAEYLPYHIKIIPLIFSHLGIFFAYNVAFTAPTKKPTSTELTIPYRWKTWTCDAHTQIF